MGDSFWQEILDQIADIDLVINFKNTEEPLIRKNLGAGNFSGFHEYSTICSSGSSQNLQPQDKGPKCLSATTEYSWKEMKSMEQVTFNFQVGIPIFEIFNKIN